MIGKEDRLGTLDGKVAVITGSGRGIGKEVARVFIRQGANVVINDVDEAVAVEAVKELGSESGRAVYCIADIRSIEEAQKLMKKAQDEFGKLDILVNNAGLARDTLAGRMSAEQWQLVIDINLTGAFNCIRAASKYMMKKGHGGRVINVSSVVGLAGNAGQLNYAASKAGIIGMTKTLAKEWMRYGVTVNAVAFGGVDTRFTAVKDTAEEAFGEKTGVPAKAREGMVERMETQTIFGGMTTPEQAAQCIYLLALPEAEFITGNVLNATGGLYM